MKFLGNLHDLIVSKYIDSTIHLHYHKVSWKSARFDRLKIHRLHNPFSLPESSGKSPAHTFFDPIPLDNQTARTHERNETIPQLSTPQPPIYIMIISQTSSWLGLWISPVTIQATDSCQRSGHDHKIVEREAGSSKLTMQYRAGVRNTTFFMQSQQLKHPHSQLQPPQFATCRWRS